MESRQTRTVRICFHISLRFFGGWLPEARYDTSNLLCLAVADLQ